MTAIEPDVPRELVFEGAESKWGDEVCYAAKTPWGTYRVSVYRGHQNVWASPDTDKDGVRIAGGFFEADNPGPAFDAAQADYEARFLSGKIPLPDTSDPNSDSYRERMIWWRGEAVRWKREAERLAEMDSLYVRRSYSILEIVELRRVIAASKEGVALQPSEIEMRVRTHMLAGHTAADFE